MTAASARIRLPALAVRFTSALATPVTLYAIAVTVGIISTNLVNYPTNEGSAYYVAVARNLTTGRGLVIDSIWSYATPPLVLPRPAFELWQPMASLIGALSMSLLNATFGAAQLGGVLLGAGVAPLAWAITRDAGRQTGLPSAARVETVAFGAGVLAAVSAPTLIALAAPDSTLPFMVFGALACWLAPKAWADGGRPVAGLALGVALGLAYLSRHEAAYIGAVVLAVGLSSARAREGLGSAVRWLGPAVAGGLVVVGPWLARNLLVFGTPFPGQALDNALLTTNEQIFAYADQPTLGAFLAQGPARLAGNVVAAGVHNLVEVLLIMAMPVGAVGLAAAVWLAARRRDLGRTALGMLLLSGVVTFAVATLVFPVASLWGTFQHAAGPLLMGLTVAAVVGADAVVDAVRRRRGWSRANAWLAPLALVLVTAPLAAFQVALLARSAADTGDRFDALAAAVAAQPEVARDGDPIVISDRPIWLSEVTGLPTLALPAEPPEVVLRLARDMGGAKLIVVAEERGDYPAAFRSGGLGRCFEERDVAGLPTAAIFAIDPECLP